MTDHVTTKESLRDRLSINVWMLLILCAIALFFLYCNYLPLYHTDLWGHVAYGNWMLEHRQIPEEDPFVVLAAGIRQVDTSWFSQLAFGWLEKTGGAALLSDFYAVLCLSIFVLYFAATAVRSQSIGVGFLAALATWAMYPFRLAILRPEMLGGLGFALLLFQFSLIDRKRRDSLGAVPNWAFVSIPLTMIFWANSHGSYIVGIAVMGCSVAGAVLETVVSERSLLAIFRSQRVWSEFFLFVLTVGAACINPYGINLLLQTLLFPSHPNLSAVAEWSSLEMKSLEGIPVGLSWLIAAFVIRHSRAKFPVRDVLISLMLTLAVCMRVRMIAWYAPACWFVLAPHLGNIARQIRSTNFANAVSARTRWLSKPSLSLTLVSGFAVYLAFAFSPISRHVMGGKPRPAKTLYSYQTPMAVSKYFREHPPEGMVYVPQWWGDWLVWDGPDDLSVMTTTNTIHLLPHPIWQDYLGISRRRDGYLERLDHYGINTMVASKDLQPGLVRELRDLDRWQLVHEDELSIVIQRKSMLDGDVAAGEDSTE